MISYNWLDYVIRTVGSDFFSNIIAFCGFAITIGTLIVGGKKVSEKASEVLLEYNERRRNAIFSFHENLKVYIFLIERLITDNQNEPMKTLYLFCNDEILRKKGCGYESLAKELQIRSHKCIDYLSSKPEQIPTAKSENEDNEWCSLIHNFTLFLADFLLYDSGCYLSDLNSEDAVKDYHRTIVKNLEAIKTLLDQERKEFWNKQRKAMENETEQNR